MSKISRREFMGMTAATIAATQLSITSFGAFAKAIKGEVDINKFLILNNLGGISNPNRAEQNDNKDSDHRIIDKRALKDAFDSGLTMVNQTIGYVGGPMEPFEHSIKTIAQSNEMIANYPEKLLKVLSTEDIYRAKQEGKIGILQGFQNAAMMGSDASRVGIFAGLGVRVIQLTYNIRNQLGDGSMVVENTGLTDFGHDVIAELNKNKLVIDLSHSGENTCLEAIKASKESICISHTGCQALADMPRNKTDQELRQVAERGGVVGIYFMPFLKEDSFPNADDVVHHIEHAIKVCGEDHVGIGTDGGTTSIDDLEAMRKAVAKQVKKRQELGIAAKGEKPGVVPFVPDLSGPSQFQKLADKLHARGHSIARIEKILGTNFLRFYKQVWGK